MRKILYLTVIFAFFGLSLNAQEKNNLYWDFSKVDTFNEVKTKKYILLKGINSKEELRSKLLLPDLNIISFGLNKTMSNTNASDNSKIEAYAIIESDNLSNVSLSSLNFITYEISYFKDEKNKEIGLTHLFYVKLNTPDDVVKLKQITKEFKVDIVDNNKYMPLWYTIYCSKKSKGNALEISNFFYNSKQFKAVEPALENKMLMLLNSSNCPTSDNYANWGMNQDSDIDINACEAWEYTKGSSCITVAVIDEGFDLDHQDLNNIHPLSYDATSGTYNNTTPNPVVEVYPNSLGSTHATCVMGIIGAEHNNNYSIAGVSPNSPIMPISLDLLDAPDYKLESSTIGNNWESLFADGINFAWVNGASVINLSLGSVGQDGPLMVKEAINNAITQGRGGLGCVVVAAAGNSGHNNVYWPANRTDVIAVGNLMSNGLRNANSSFLGGRVDVIAPGTDVNTTTRHAEKANVNGTSFAAPFVSGIAALVLSVNDNIPFNEVKKIIESSVKKLPNYSYSTTLGRTNGSWNIETGYGLVDAEAAVAAATQWVSSTVGVNPDFAINQVIECGKIFTIETENMVGDGTVEYEWDFGNDIIETSTNPVPSLSPSPYNGQTEEDVYIITLTITDGSGCKTIIKKPICLKKPDVNITGETEICGFNSIELCADAFVPIPSSAVSYKWYNENNDQVGSGECISIYSPGTYTLEYTIGMNNTFISLPHVVNADLSINPQWSTFWGGGGAQKLMYGDTDDLGNPYVAGQTYDDINGEILSLINGPTPFVTKFNTRGIPIWSTPIDGLNGVICKIKNRKNTLSTYVAGATTDNKAFVAKIHQELGLVDWVKVIEIDGAISAEGLAVYGNDIYISGTLRSINSNDPLANYESSKSPTIYGKATAAAYCIKLTDSPKQGAIVEWSTYLSSGSDSSWGVDTDSNGQPYVISNTAGLGLYDLSDVLITDKRKTPKSIGNGKDILVAKLKSSDGDLDWYTFYGRSGVSENSYDVIIDRKDNVLIAGNGSVSSNEVYEGLLISIKNNGVLNYAQNYESALLFHALDVDNQNNIYIKGFGKKNINYNPPLGSYVSSTSGDENTTDAIVYKLKDANSVAPSVYWFTKFGGNEDEYGSVVMYHDQTNSLYVGGRTESGNFETNHAVQGDYMGGYDGFLTKFNCQKDLVGIGFGRLNNTNPPIKGVNKLKESISVYPNPSTSGKFTIKISSISTRLKQEELTSVVEIINMNGIVIYRNEGVGLTNDIDISNHSKGMYFMKIQIGEKQEVRKLIYQ